MNPLFYVTISISILLLVSSSFFLKQVGYSSHFSKPIITEIILSPNQTISISGITDYFGPISDISLQIIMKETAGKVWLLNSTISDINGEFHYKHTLPNYFPTNNYTLEVMSQCRIEHQSFCTTLTDSIQIRITNDLNLSKDSSFKIDDAIQEKIQTKALEIRDCNGEGNIMGKENIGDLAITGTENDDIIIGTSGNDTIAGFGGNDTICGMAGHDTIYSGLGFDTIYGNEGNDTIDGSYGNDILFGNEGNDIIKTNSGINVCYGSEQVSNCYY